MPEKDLPFPDTSARIVTVRRRDHAAKTVPDRQKNHFLHILTVKPTHGNLSQLRGYAPIADEKPSRDFLIACHRFHLP